MDELFNNIKTMFDTLTQEKGYEYTVGAFSGTGWLEFHYVCSSYDGPYPRMSLKQYDKTVNAYFFLYEQGASVVEKMGEIFGKSNVGKSCIRIRKLNDERIEALKFLVEKSLEVHEKERQ